MFWSRLRGLPPGLRYLPKDDWPPQPAPVLTRPFEAGVTGWVVVFGAVIAELAGGAAVATQMRAVIAVPVLIFPAAVASAFAVVQWWQARSWRAELASRWHLTGVAAAALTWLLWPMVPGALAGTGTLGCTGRSQALCYAAPGTAEATYLRSLAQSADYHDVALWSTGALILIAALLARRSRIAAWAAIPAAFAGCELATYFLT
jgi:hypothetical protein